MSEENNKRLLTLTTLLNEKNKQAQQFFLNDVKNNAEYEADFYNQVKPFGDEIKALAEEWSELAIRWIRKEKPRYVHPLNIKNTYDNLLIISVQAFFKDTREKRFNEMVESISFILNELVAEIKKRTD
jgi:hypothetical protein